MLIEDCKTLPKEFPFEILRYCEKKRDRGKSDIAHWHKFIEITYVESGSAKYYVEGVLYEVGAGDIIIFNHMESHRWEVMSGELELMVLTFSSRIVSDSMNSMDLEYLIPFLSRGSNFANKISKSEEYVLEIKSMMEEILREQLEQKSGRLLMIKADILRILTILVRHYQKDLMSVSKLKNAALRIEESIEYMKENYAEKITLNDVASIAAMCPNYFSSYFKNVTGTSFQECLSTIRLEQARDKLKNTQEGIVDIAQSCGVYNLSNFYRLYKKFYGIAPGEERN